MATTCVLADDDLDRRIHAFETSLAPAVQVAGEPETRWTLQERMTHWNVPGFSVAVIRDGRIAWARAYGVLQQGAEQRVDTDTVFSVGSVSKVGTAATALRLVDAGVLDLDRPVNDYLQRWQVPGNEHTAVRPVTLRGIMSHTAGLSVHGFPDFLPGADLPDVIDTLDGRPPALTDPVRVIYTPGSRYKYSGGGTTLEQLLIEEVTQAPFTDATRLHLFEPLDMRRSTYENPLPLSHGNIARAHDANGDPVALPRGYQTMPEAGASGLWTTPRDYARLVIALLESFRGSDGSFLSQSLARQMMSEVGPGARGLGPELHGRGKTRRFSHSGANDSYRALMEGHLYTGDGVVMLTNAAQGANFYEEARRAVAAAEGWGPAFSEVRSVPAVALSGAELDELAGTYRLEPPVTRDNHRLYVSSRLALEAVAYQVSHVDGGLFMARAGSDRKGLRLIPEDPTHFVLEDAADQFVEFVRGYDGRVEFLILRYGQHSLDAVKL